MYACASYYQFYYTYRNGLLVFAESSDTELLMLLKVIDLLASCAEGENLFIESICQNVIGISELLQVVHACIHVCYVHVMFIYRFCLCKTLI